MKALLKFLTVCLITLVLISPALVVWRIWEYHNEFVSVQRVVLQDNYTALNQALSLKTNDREFSPTLTVQSPSNSVSSAITIPALLSLIASVPLGFYSGLLLSNRYQTRHNTTLERQVATLEKIWQQSIY
jgi:hypothetical protein